MPGKKKQNRSGNGVLSPEEIDIPLIPSYLKEAIENEKAGKSNPANINKPFEIPDELKQALSGDKELASRFNAFSNFKKREFAEYLLEAKRPATRVSRLQKIIPMIMIGVGLNDKYRK